MYSLGSPSLPPWPLANALTVVGAAAALLAFLVFISLGVLLPGVLTALGGPPARRDAFPEFGPLAHPVISQPAPSPAAHDRERRAARPLLWRHLSGLAVPAPASLEASREC